ncbi:MAG TPA: hypothetical protein VE133_13715, partial [Candidatus Sulfotelmatobacter sp.]|nr:hypothetical protein [Candidatus Sulfotelmatobacter sp.]
FDAAYSEVGGSYDECHGQHTTFAYSVMEGLNIGGMVTADRVIARMAIYSPKFKENGSSQSQSKTQRAAKGEASSTNGVTEDDDDEHSFDITGSYFENLRIAGHKIDIQLATHRLHDCRTYKRLAGEMKKGAHDLQPWGNLSAQKLTTLGNLEPRYHALTGLSTHARNWQAKQGNPGHGGGYWLSAAGHYELNTAFPDSELHGFGGIICIPKFGVVHLAEIIVHEERRQLQMIRVEMCSTSSGSVSGGGAGGGGSMPPPG